MKIYVASSWRNEYQQEVVAALRAVGHQVYDFKNPGPGKSGFDWKDIDQNWKKWDNDAYIQALDHPIAERGFTNDFDAMQWADACVMVMPCGRSAHVEAGYMQGAGKPTIVLLGDPPEEPELMYKMFELVTSDLTRVIDHLGILEMMLEAEEESWGIRHCRVCGCTDNDCRQCIEKTGQPCHWVAPNLCSACVDQELEPGGENKKRKKL